MWKLSSGGVMRSRSEASQNKSKNRLDIKGQAHGRTEDMRHPVGSSTWLSIVSEARDSRPEARLAGYKDS